MTLKEFNNLSEIEKTEYALTGNFVDLRYEDELKVALYSHANFYTEVFYDGQNNLIVRCQGFTALSSLASYIHLN